MELRLAISIFEGKHYYQDSDWFLGVTMFYMLKSYWPNIKSFTFDIDCIFY